MSAAPDVLLPYQQAWVADQSQVKVCEKSRRTGLSWCTACESVLAAAADDGQDVWYVGYNKEMAQEFIRDCADWAKNLDQVASKIEESVIKDEDKDILTFTIRFKSGFRITALSSRPSNLRGKQGKVIIDEAAFHDDLAELLKAAMALLMWGGSVEVISTHNGVDNPFNELVQNIRSGKKEFAKFGLHRITLDDALEQGLFKRICLTDKSGKKKWSPEAEAEWREDLVNFYGSAADEELFCVPRNSGGAYLSRTLIESRMVERPVFCLELKDEFAQREEAERIDFIEKWCEETLSEPLIALPSLPHAFGEDFGRVSDLTCIAPATLEKDLERTHPFLVELRNVPFECQRQILFYIVDRLPRLLGGALDATGNGAYLAEVAAQRYGATRIAQVKLSDTWYAENLPPFKAAFEDGTISIPKHVDVLSDLRALQVIGGVPKLPKAKTSADKNGKTRHGDAAIALALAYFASRLSADEYEYYPVVQRERRPGDDADELERSVRVRAGIRNHHGGIL